MTKTLQNICPCGSNNPYENCCGKIHRELNQATSAEQLMRARYSAFVIQNIDFIYNTFHPSTRKYQNKRDIESWAKESKWMQLEIIKSTLNTVEFKAHYLDADMNIQIHHEKSNFKKLQNFWYYVDGKILNN